eukprot:5270760-Amphidinium_carterae.1
MPALCNILSILPKQALSFFGSTLSELIYVTSQTTHRNGGADMGVWQSLQSQAAFCYSNSISNTTSDNDRENENAI